jgi:endonuclease/exonuclease/phosphatase family metal-dependent hydrolase
MKTVKVLSRSVTVALAALVFPAFGPNPVGAQQAVPFRGERIVTVMTRNVYHGVNAEMSQVATATSLPDLLSKVAAVYNGYHVRNFPERAAALAAEIEATRPDFIGLQEAVEVRTQAPPDGQATPATTVALDYVRILLEALAARGLAYERVATSVGWVIELPSALGVDVRHIDREVILARADLTTADLKLANAQTGHFAVNCVLHTRIGTITIKRGWVSVDVKIRGKQFRLVSTHLDGDCHDPATQIAQANELALGPGATDLPLVFVGDFNSDAASPSTGAYGVFMAAGFVDAWSIAGSGPGLTCCQDSFLLNPVSLLSRRIDLVLFRGEFGVIGAQVVGDAPADRAPSGLWPSDHAGVVATLQVPDP